MKIGTITYHRAINYGSVLQAFALNHYLRSSGFDAEIINYHTIRQDNLYTIFEKNSSVKAFARNVQSLLYYNALKKRRKRFENFLRQRVVLSQYEYTEQSDLSNLNNLYSIFICGSDQIWNPRCDDFSEAYLLNLVRNKQSCIAYAPSIGTDKFTSEFEIKFSSSIRDFSALSLRENNSINYIANLIGRGITCVPDPVLLLSKSEWQKIAKPRLIQKPYIFCYFIGDVNGMRSFSKLMYLKTGLELVVINKNLRDLFYLNNKCYAAGPEEFISLIMHCDYICTNSYHAVIFSLLFQKDFWVFTDMGEGSSKSRIESILESVGLTDRILNDKSPFPKDPTIPVDFCGIAEYLSDFSNKGKDFLHSSLNIRCSHDSIV